MFDYPADSTGIKSQTARLREPGEIMADFALVSTSGTRIRISDYRGRRNLILIFSGRGDSQAVVELLRQVSEKYSEIVSEEALVLAVVQRIEGWAGPLEQSSSLPFLVLLDEESRVHHLVGVVGPDCSPVVYVIDRHGEIRHVYRVEEAPSASMAGDILDWVRYVNLECPE